MELNTERIKLKDILPDKSSEYAKEYNLKEEDIEFIRKKNPLRDEDITIEEGERAAIRYINTADVDRDSEIVLPDGLIVDEFNKSRTVLYAHDYHGLPIGRDAWIKHVKGKGWLAKTIYANHQLANDVYNLVKDKFLNTSSIGFIPLEWVTRDDKEWVKTKSRITEKYGMQDEDIEKANKIYTKALLLEHSDVPVPSNINALNIAVGKGYEIKSPEIIEDFQIKIITKPEETDEYVRIPVEGEEGKHEDHKIRTITISADEGIKALYCVDDKINITYLFEISKGWTMAKAKKWMKDHEKQIVVIEQDDKLENENIELKTMVKEMLQKLEDATTGLTDIKDLEELKKLKAGAVLNRKNKSDLKSAQQLIQNVIDSSEPEEEKINITDEKPNDRISITEEELGKIVREAINDIKTEQDLLIKKGLVTITDNIKSDVNNSIKIVTGKVM